jgi:predicted lipoprotein with Yx(FWY)xxD motif
MRKALLLLPAALAVALAGCGASGHAAAGQAANAQTAASKHAIVKTRHGSLGTTLVDGSGRTLYRFQKDKGRRSHCSGACAKAWPPLTTREKPEAKGGAKASRLSTTRRSDGTLQVVYAGHPVYRYALDSARGDTNGQGVNAFGARWYVVASSGKVIRGTGDPAPSSTPTPMPYPY